MREAPALYRASSTTEKSFYPPIKELFSRLLEARGLPFEVRAGTSERRAGGAGVDQPDLALFDGGEFVSVFVEVKNADTEIREMAVSTERNDQVGRYLAQTGVVLLCNVRSVGLLACKPGYARQPSRPVPPEGRDLLDVINLWPSESALAKGRPVPAESLEELADLIERAVTEFAPISDPGSLARILARQARKAKEDLPARFDAVARLLEDYRTALGLSFDLEDQKGAEFFRSSLIQTAYYGVFAGWTLWHRAGDGTPFEWERMDRYLNRSVCLSNVPEQVWRYEVGGYPVIKKWLGYRQASRRQGRPLTLDEVAHLRSIVQRLATLPALDDEMNSLYDLAAADAFTAEELGLRA